MPCANPIAIIVIKDSEAIRPYLLTQQPEVIIPPCASVDALGTTTEGNGELTPILTPLVAFMDQMKVMEAVGAVDPQGE